MTDAFDAPAAARGSDDRTELRGMAPVALAQALDALALSKNLDRNAYVVGVLEEHVRERLAEVSVVAAALQGNPLMPERTRRGS
jgi:hypothetical protein